MDEKLKEAQELLKKNQEEREQRAIKRINDFILQVQEEEGVNVFIQPIQIQPQLIIQAR